MATTHSTRSPARSIGAEMRRFTELLYGQACADGDDLLSEQCSAIMDAWDALAAMTPFSLREGAEYVTRDGHMAVVLRLDYQEEFRGALGATALVMLRKPGMVDQVEIYRRNGAFGDTAGAVPSSLDIVGYWHGGLAAHAPALPEHRQAAE